MCADVQRQSAIERLWSADHSRAMREQGVADCWVAGGLGSVDSEPNGEPRNGLGQAEGDNWLLQDTQT